MAAQLNLSGPPDSGRSSLTDQSMSSRTSNRSLRVAEKERRKNEAEDPSVLALQYFYNVEAGTPVNGNDEVERNLVLVEQVAYRNGLSPEAISIMLEFAMSLRMGHSLCPRVLKCLIPVTVVPQEAVVRGVSWLGVGKIPVSTQVLFIKWVLTVFDMIDAKDQLRAIYGFIFSFVSEENLGRQPFLLNLLSLYKVFCPELVTLSIPSRSKSVFKNHNMPWKSALFAVQKRNGSQVASSISLASASKDGTNRRKRKHHHLEIPVLSAVVNKQPQTETSRRLVPLVQIQSVAELLENMDHIELPAQMGSLLGSSLALQYLDCVQDESALLRLNFWLGYALHEEIGRLLFEPLMQLFFTSSVFFKCGLIECLNNMLLKWLIWHSVYALEDDLDISLNSHTSINMTLSGFKDSVMGLVDFVGRLASIGLQLEGCHSLLLSFILDFYTMVCDTFLKYGLPLVVMPPPGVFYPALFATDPVSVDRLAFIMYRYKVNLTSAKSQEKLTEQAFHISRQTFREFNNYTVYMVNCLWNSKMFQPGMGVQLGEELLLKSNVPQYWTSFDLVHHPAFMSYAIDFHQKHSKPWSWYLEYLFSQGYDGLALFVQSNIRAGQGNGQQGDSLST
nr:centromere protein I [Pseudochaenichthys georgianus]